ncbi:MAG: hypothetical protein HY078_08405 [Elusimicrobia bacterium]|nr:hypothetical protein [Elusimicrobiota bacterium]
MKQTIRLLAATLLLWGNAPSVHALGILKTDKLSMDLFGRGQMIGVIENVPDPYRDHNRLYLFMKQARLGVKGAYEDYRYETQLAFGGEDANGSNTDLSLLDFVADIPIRAIGNDTWFKIGQFRVPYSREGLADRGYLDWADRSVSNLGSFQSRDYGMALMATKGVWTGTIGTFSSGGRDVPQRYLPERLGVPYMATRFGYNDGFDDDIYHVVTNRLDAKRTVKAVMFNAIYMQDTKIGHSTALQSRTIDKNLLIDTGFNPYINQGGTIPGTAGNVGLGTIAGSGSMARGNMYWLGGDAAIRHPLGGDRSVGGELEANWGGYQNRYGVLHLANFRAQGDYQVKSWGFGVRYGLLSMDKRSGFLSSSATGTGTAAGAAVKQVVNNDMGIPIHEVAPSITWHFRGHNIKVVSDLPIYLNCPLWYDRVGNIAAATGPAQPVGVYAFPDSTSTTQNSLLATPGNFTARRTVVEARMMFQFQF